MVLMVLLALPGLPGCGGGPTIALSDGQRAADGGRADVSAATTTVVELVEYAFRPAVLTGRPGQRLTITLSNQGNALHDFRLASQQLDLNVEPAAPVTVTVTFPSSGAVSFECRYHLLQHMRGELVAGAG